MIEPRQIRAARALLNWSQGDLAKASGIAVSSIKNIENNLTIARKDSLAQIKEAFEMSGIEFLPNSGVRMRTDIVQVIDGADGLGALQESIYTTCQSRREKEVFILGMDEAYCEKYDGKQAILDHVERLKEAGIHEKIIACEGDSYFLNKSEAYRWIPKKYFARNTPVYIYGDKVAIQAGTVQRKTIIIHYEQLAEHLKKIFHFVWDQSPSSH